MDSPKSIIILLVFVVVFLLFKKISYPIKKTKMPAVSMSVFDYIFYCRFGRVKKPNNEMYVIRQYDEINGPDEFLCIILYGQGNDEEEIALGAFLETLYICHTGYAEACYQILDHTPIGTVAEAMEKISNGSTEEVSYTYDYSLNRINGSGLNVSIIGNVFKRNGNTEISRACFQNKLMSLESVNQ